MGQRIQARRANRLFGQQRNQRQSAGVALGDMGQLGQFVAGALLQQGRGWHGGGDTLITNLPISRVM